MNNMKLVDMHCDTLGVLLHTARKAAESGDLTAIPTLLHNSFHIDLEKLQKANYLLQNFAVFIWL